MSIKPIDRQTLFAKMSDVSKEQSLIKEHVAHQQNQAARSQVAKELEEDRRVIETPEDHETETVRDENHGEARKQKQKQNGAARGSGKDDKEIVSDPTTGLHIDLSG